MRARRPPPAPDIGRAAPPGSPSVGDAVVVRGTVAHVAPTGMVCVATGRSFLWVLPSEAEPDPNAFSPDADLFG